jgi:WD40 repeat protein
MAFSPDCKSIVAACGGEKGLSLRFWQTSSGKELSRFQVGEDRSAYSVGGLAFLPDGKRLILYSATPQMYDCVSGKLLRSFQGVGHAYAYDVSPDGRMLATQVYVGPDYLIHLWDTATGKELKRFGKQIGSSLGLKFSADSTRLMSADVSNGICIWDIASGEMLHQLNKKFHTVALARNGKSAAVAVDRGGIVEVVDVATGKKHREIKAENSDFEFMPDSRGLVSKGWFDSPILWNLSTGQVTRQFPSCRGHRVAGISGDGKMLATITNGSRDSSIMLWNIERGEPFHQGGGHCGTVTGLAFSHDGKMVASGDEDGMVRLWTADTGKELGSIKAHKHCILAVAFALGGKLLATTAADGNTRLWEVPSGRLANPESAGKDFDGGAFASSKPVLRFSPDGKTMTVGSLGGPIEVWDLADSKRNRSIAIGPNETGIAQSRNTLLTVSAIDVFSIPFGCPGNLSVWSMTPHKPIRQLASGKDLACWAAAISADDRIIVSAHSRVSYDGRGGINARDHTIRLWERSTAEPIVTIKGYRINTLEFSRDCRIFAAGHGNNISWHNREVTRDVTIWNSLTGEKLRTLTGHADDIACLAFAPDGKRLASGSADHTVLIWNDLPNPHVKPLNSKVTDERLESHWKDLGGNATLGYRAISLLLQHPDQTVALLRAKLKPTLPVDAKRIEELIGALNNERYADRQIAMKELESFGDLAEFALRKSLARNPSLEVRRRMEQLLEKAESAPLGTRDLQLLRSLALLEWIGTTDARHLLATLSEGAPESRQTRLAQEVMRRLATK